MTDEKTQEKSRGGGFCLPAAIILILILLILIALPNYMRPGRHPEAEVKSNLHAIQLGIERFAVDTEGVYPAYLIGGEPKYARSVNALESAYAFTDIVDCEQIEMVSDPLLREGYLDAYPRNPFVNGKAAKDIHKLQDALASSVTGNDPLRNGAPEGVTLGTRFGAYCNRMGQVLCDPRREKRYYEDPQTGELKRLDTWAIVEYEFWDIWQDDKPRPFLPGQFFYKASGPVISFGGQGENAGNEHLTLEGDRINPPGFLPPDGVPVPMEFDQYILAAYGGLMTKGKDILGEEGAIYPVPAGGGQPASVPFETWTRSEYSAKSRMGSPYSFTTNVNDQLAYGNPNGIRDSIILVLTAGEDYIGDR